MEVTLRPLSKNIGTSSFRSRYNLTAALMGTFSTQYRLYETERDPRQRREMFAEVLKTANVFENRLQSLLPTVGEDLALAQPMADLLDVRVMIREQLSKVRAHLLN